MDLDALMADLCSIEQELSSFGSHSANNAAVKRLATEPKTQKPPASRPSTKHSSVKGLPSSSAKVTKPSPANVSLDDITAQLEKASLSMDEAAQQSVAEDTKPGVTGQHRRTASAGTVSDAEVRSISNSSRSSVTSAASSMDSLDIDKVTRPQELDLTSQGQPISEVGTANSRLFGLGFSLQTYTSSPVLNFCSAVRLIEGLLLQQVNCLCCSYFFLWFWFCLQGNFLQRMRLVLVFFRAFPIFSSSQANHAF